MTQDKKTNNHPSSTKIAIYMAFIMGMGLPIYLEWQRPAITKGLIKRVLNMFYEKRQAIIQEYKYDWKFIEPDINHYDPLKRLAFYLMPNRFKHILAQSENNQCIDLTVNSQFMIYLAIHHLLRDFSEEWHNEDHFMQEISKYKLVYHIPRSCDLPYELKSKIGMEQFFTHVVGIPFFHIKKYTSDKIDYILDMNVLKQFEHRPEHTLLGGKIYLSLEDQQFHFDDRDQDIERLLVSYMIYNNNRYHATLHFFSNNFNYFIKKNLPLEHPVMRFLSYFRLFPYGINEVAVITLLAPSGFGMTTNLSMQGLTDAMKHFINTKPFHEVCNPAYHYERYGITMKTLYDFLIYRAPENSVMQKSLLWWKTIHDFSTDFFNSVDESHCEEFQNILLASDDYSDFIKEELPEKENTINVCAQVLYTAVVHEMLSNNSLCSYASNPFILPSTLRRKHAVPNVASTIRAASLWNSTNMPSATFDDPKWKNIIARTIAEKRAIQEFEKNVRKINGGVLHYENIETSIRW